MRLKLLFLFTTSLTAPGAALAQSTVQEVIVTASRREESVLRTPYNISAYGAERLEKAGISDVASLARLSPGIAVLDTGATNQSNRNPVTLRGLNVNDAEIPIRADGAVPTVSQYVGEVPTPFPVATFDLARVEVLRGPQGTLYGSGSLAGALRFVPRAPDMRGMGGYLTGSLGSAAHASGADSYLEGALNIPLGSAVAIRVAGGAQRAAGFIDSIGLVQLDAKGAPTPRVAGDANSGFLVRPAVRDNNPSEGSFARISLLFDPEGPFRLALSTEHQRTTARNPQEINPDFPGATIDYSALRYPGSLYVNAAGVPGGAFRNGATTFPAGNVYAQTHMLDSPSDRESQVENATATYEFGFGELTSSTSYVEFDSGAASDRTGTFATTRAPGGVNLASFYGFYPRLIAREKNHNHDQFLTQEVRLVSSGDGPWQYVVGAFYQRQRSLQDVTETMPGVAAWFGFPAGTSDVTYTDTRRTQFTDRAIFGELTRRLSDNWKVTVGVRQFWQNFEIHAQQTFPICGSFCANDGKDPTGLVAATSKTDASDHLFKLNTSYQLNSDVLLYGTISQGYRRGGANGAPLAGVYASLPKYLTYKPDTVDNYEVGAKGRLGAAAFSVAAFVVDWHDFQFEAVTPSFGAAVVVNGSKARSKGLEAEITSYPDEGLQYSAGISYTDAKVVTGFLAKDLPLGGGAPVTLVSLNAGDRLPGVPKTTLNGSIGYAWRLGNDLRVDAQIDGSYRSSAVSDFPSSKLRYATIDGFGVVNAQIGVSRDAWKATLFVRNLTDERGETAGNFTSYDQGLLGSHRSVIRPRTIGLRLRYEFAGL